MKFYAPIFLIVAACAAYAGFTGVAGMESIAWIAFVVSIVMAVVFFNAAPTAMRECSACKKKREEEAAARARLCQTCMRPLDWQQLDPPDE